MWNWTCKKYHLQCCSRPHFTPPNSEWFYVWNVSSVSLNFASFPSYPRLSLCFPGCPFPRTAWCIVRVPQRHPPHHLPRAQEGALQSLEGGCRPHWWNVWPAPTNYKENPAKDKSEIDRSFSSVRNKMSCCSFSSPLQKCKDLRWFPSLPKLI